MFDFKFTVFTPDKPLYGVIAVLGDMYIFVRFEHSVKGFPSISHESVGKVNSVSLTHP